MNKKNLLYFLITTCTVFFIIYSGFFYDIYIHPSIIKNSAGQNEIILFGDFKYLFKIIDCHNSGFNVYTQNECYSDYYGSFLYGPSILIFPTINEELSIILTYFLSTLLIIGFIYLNLKIIKPNNINTYLLTSLIFFNPTTLFLYEKLNIEIFLYVSLIYIVYYLKKDITRLLIVILLTLTKFYPAVFGIIILIRKNIAKENIYYFLIFVIFLILFTLLFWNNLLSVVKTLDYVSQSFKYSFSLNSLNKILLYILNLETVYISKFILIIISLISSYLFYRIFVNINPLENQIEFNENFNMFILCSLLSISLYIIFSNNFYREVYLIGIIPYIINNLNVKLFKIILYLYVIKYLYLIIFFPFYYRADLTLSMWAQMLVGIKSSLDYIFITLLISSLILVFNSCKKDISIILKK